MTRTDTTTIFARGARPQPLLEIRDLGISFEDAAGGRTRAVRGLSLTVHARQTLAVVGESGCGKSVTALGVLRLVACPPGRIDGGAVFFEGRDLLQCSRREMLRVRGGDIAMIFQEPMTSLNPVYTVGAQIIEAIRLHQKVGRREARDIAIVAMRDVGITHPERSLGSYPHEFSGGMCQRAMTAMALACQPRLLIADEPTTALDVTIQAQLLDLLARIQAERDMSIVLISHDLGVVSRLADVVCVMYDGHVVEYAAAADLFANPLHPYTRGLFSSIPRLDERRRRLRTVHELMADPKEFARLPGHRYGVVPWWPDSTPPDDLAVRDPASDEATALFEVEDQHWVACWRTEFIQNHPASRPDVYRPAPAAPPQ